MRMWWSVLLLILMGPSSALSAHPVIISNPFSALLNWFRSQQTLSSKPDRNLPQFEKGYVVETVLEGNKLGINPYTLQISPDGEVLILDSTYSNIYRLTPPLSRYSRATLLAGSARGYHGYVDGKHKDARFNHPKGFTIDDRGNIYVADTMNMAIRKIGEAGVKTIAGGRTKKTGHVDGPSEDAKFSNDFDIEYISSTCSLLIVDRGNQAIREIQLHSDDCEFNYATSYSSGIVGIAVALLFGYVVGLLQKGMGVSVFQKHAKHEMLSEERIPGYNNLDTTPLGSVHGHSEYVNGNYDVKRTPRKNEDSWPLHGTMHTVDEESESHQVFENYQNSDYWAQRGAYTFSSDDLKPKTSPRNKENDESKGSDNQSRTQNRQGHSVRVVKSSLSSNEPVKEKTIRRARRGEHRNYTQSLRHQVTTPQTYYAKYYDSSNEVMFGSVQETTRLEETVEIKPVNYGDPLYDSYNIGNQFGFPNIFDY